MDERERRFRRTLVGLKRASAAARGADRQAFQTNPRGVEAVGPAGASRLRCRFQTNPRGVEARSGPCSKSSGTGFRRTLVGLKRLDHAGAGRRHSFRRTLVGLKRG